MPRTAYPPFAYRTPPEFCGGKQADAPVAIIGAGPVGLALAIDLALHGVKCVVLDDNDVVSVGSRAICWAKRTLEIFDRLGVGERMVAKGVTWKVGRLFHGSREVWSFDLLPEQGHKNPAFINLQQYHVEHYLVERCQDFPDLIDLRWKNKVIGLEQTASAVMLTVETPDGTYDMEAAYTVACDGARSTTRAMMGLEFQGRFFEERFLIADVEHYLVERCQDFPDLIDLRWKNKVTGLEQTASAVMLTVETPDGVYDMEAAYTVACDGVRSTTRAKMGLEFQGRFFEERFLITDVEMKIDQPSERWFWFEPTFHPGQSALLHKQPDNIYRIDLQLGPDADPELEKRPDRVIPRIEKAVGHSDFDLDWVSVYTFQCRRLARFVHDRVIFAGDSAHVVSPFGARGGNGGIQDADNLGWKLAAIVKGDAPSSLLESYNEERVRGADENILNSSRTTNFMSASTPVERLFRDEVLALAEQMPFARRLINSGRLSQPCSLNGLSLQTPDRSSPLPAGSPCLDAPVIVNRKPGFLLDRLGGDFCMLSVGEEPPRTGLRTLVSSRMPGSGLHDEGGFLSARYGEGWTYLIRPDQHVAAAWQKPNADDVQLATDRATSKVSP